MTNCSYCKSKCNIIREFQRWGDETLHLWGCSECKSELLSPQPSDDWLAKEYSDYFQMRQGNIAEPKKRLCQLILSKLSPLPDTARILDIGGGEGFFASEVLQSLPNAHVTLVEPQAEETRFAPDRVAVHRKLVEDWLNSTSPELYDAIVGMDLIEHLRHPTLVMAELVRTRLKKGGRLILTTPDAASWYRKLLGPVWPHYKVEHLTYPSKKALSSFAIEAELELQECSSLAKPLPVGYIIAVLRQFGPLPLRAIGRVIDIITPKFARGCHVRLPSGELLFVAFKRS